MAVSGKEFGIAAAVDAAVAVGMLAIFAVLRRLKFASRYYAPKRYLKTKYKRPKRLRSGLFSWMRQIFNYDERDVLEIAGMDAVMYFRIISFCMKLVMFLAFWNLATVLPTNLTGHNVDEILSQGDTKKYNISDMDKLSIVNLSDKDNKLWVHVVSAYVTSLFTLRLLWVCNRQAVQLRVHYLSTTPKGGQSHSVLVTDIPGDTFGTVVGRALQFLPRAFHSRIERFFEKTKDVAKTSVTGLEDVAGTVGDVAGLKLRSNRTASEIERLTCVHAWKKARQKLNEMNFEGMVVSEFKEVFPQSEVAHVTVVHDETTLERVVAVYKSVLRELEDLVDDYTRKLRRRKKVKPIELHIAPDLFGSWAKEKYPTDLAHKVVKVDKLDFLANRLEALQKEVRDKQEMASRYHVGSAFVTFKSRWMQAVSSTSLHHHDESVWRVQPAPGPGEVFWPNLRLRSWEKKVRSMLVWSVFAVICCTFMIPVTFVQALVQVGRLEKIAFLKDVIEISVIRSILTAILPGLILKIFVNMLLMLIKFMNELEGMVSMSQIDFGVITKFFMFQVLTVFFGSFIVGSLAGQIEGFLNHPDGIIHILGFAAPQTATFFCTYILVEAFLVTPIGLLRPRRFALYCVRHILAATERAKARLWQQQPMAYGGVVPHHTIAILLGIVYAAINPVITVAVLLYFIMNVFVWRYQLLYVKTEKYQSGGRIWLQVFDQILAGLVIMQIMMIGFLGVKKFPYAPIVIPLPFITLFFKIASDQCFKRPLTVLSLRGAADIDRHDKEVAEWGPSSRQELHRADRLYLSPNFNINFDENEGLFAQARAISAELSGEDVTLETGPRDSQSYWTSDEDDDDPAEGAGGMNTARVPLLP